MSYYSKQQLKIIGDKIMGQRTQMLIQTVNNKGEKKNRLYHFQWGFGRTMFLQLMDLYLSDYFKDCFQKDYSVFDVTKLTKHAYDITNEVDIPEDLDINNIEQVKSIFEHCDNNNGGMVIQVTEDKVDYHGFHYLIGLVLGYEGCWDYDKEIEIEKPFSRFVSWKEFFEKEGGEFCENKGFLQMWRGFIKFGNIKFIKPTKTNKKNV